MTDAPARRRAPVLPAAGRPASVATVLSLGATALVLGVELAVPGGWGAASWVPLVVGLLLGLPHGAVDHLGAGAGAPGGASRPGVLALGYAALAVAAYLTFRWAPGPALAVFVVLSAWHFGSGETAFADLRAGRPVRRQVAAAGVLGAVVVLLPLARGGVETAAVGAAVVPGWDGVLPPVLATTVTVVVLAGAAVLGGVRLRARRWPEAGELAALLALVLVVPPPAAFGAYFGTWHSVRHVARLLAADPAGAADLAAGRLGPPLRRFARSAALPTVAVLAVLAVLWSAGGGWRGFVADYLPVLAALTVPHALVVRRLDRAQAAQGPARCIGTCGMPSST